MENTRGYRVDTESSPLMHALVQLHVVLVRFVDGYNI